jgi:S1-C subfamily serine protease
LGFAACAPSRPADVYQRVHRSVVRIESAGREVRLRFGQPYLAEARGEGAGFVWTRSGQILTAGHVANGASRVWLRYFDGRRIPARVLYSNPDAEIAVLAPAGPWPDAAVPIEAGHPAKAEIGDRLLVIGNPLGIEHSLSVGVVSGKHPRRHLPEPEVQADLIQTDAAITSGNSGGPILDGNGKVIAVASFVLSNGIGAGLGFGVSIDSVRRALAAVRCTDLGYDSIELSRPQLTSLGVPPTWRRARLVQNVYMGTPASRAKLRPGGRPVLLGGRPALVGGDVILESGRTGDDELLLWREGSKARIRFPCGARERIAMPAGEKRSPNG